MDGVVDGESSLVVQHPFRTTTVNDAAVRTDEQQIRDGHEAERDAEGVDPEVVLEDGIAERQVSRDTLFETEHAEHTEGLSKPLLATASLILGSVVGDGLQGVSHRTRWRTWTFVRKRSSLSHATVRADSPLGT